ncbi:tmcA, partial [Symbiodinium sp. CCMP2456]
MRWSRQRSPGTSGDHWNGLLPEVPGIPAASHAVQEMPARDGSTIHIPPELLSGDHDAESMISSASFVAFAETLVENCGSLVRAFNFFDYNHTGKVTRTQWDAGISSLHIDVQALCGVSTKQVYKMMDSIRGHGKGEVQLEKWIAFFEQHLTPLHTHLLDEDRGDMRNRRWSQSSQTSQSSRGRRPSFSNRASEEVRA